MIENKRNNKGFTLLEVIVSVIITATIASLILTFLTSSFKNFNVTENALQLQNDSQATMNIMMDNIMSCSKIVSVEDIDGNPIDLAVAQTSDTFYYISKITFYKELDTQVYEETYEYDSAKNEITFTRTQGGIVKTSGLFASKLDTNGMVLHVYEGLAISEMNYVTLELKFIYDDYRVNLMNTARYRNRN